MCNYDSVAAVVRRKMSLSDTRAALTRHVAQSDIVDMFKNALRFPSSAKF